MPTKLDKEIKRLEKQISDLEKLNHENIAPKLLEPLPAEPPGSTESGLPELRVTGPPLRNDCDRDRGRLRERDLVMRFLAAASLRRFSPFLPPRDLWGSSRQVPSLFCTL